MFWHSLLGWSEQISWSTCVEGESKKAGPGHSNYKVIFFLEKQLPENLLEQILQLLMCKKILAISMLRYCYLCLLSFLCNLDIGIYQTKSLPNVHSWILFRVCLCMRMYRYNMHWFACIGMFACVWLWNNSDHHANPTA